MKASFSKAADSVAAAKIGSLGALDATVHPNTARKYGVTGYPTLKYFEYGVLRKEYNGKRTSEDLYAFMAAAGAGTGETATKDEL